MFIKISWYLLCICIFSIVCQKLKPEFLEKTYNSMESNFRMLSRAIIGIAYNLHHNRDLR